MSQPCCSLGRFAKSGTLTGIVLGATVALTVALFSPWQALDAATPGAGDDPFTNRQTSDATPLARSQRGLHPEDAKGLMLSNWSYTDSDSTGFPH